MKKTLIFFCTLLAMAPCFGKDYKEPYEKDEDIYKTNWKFRWTDGVPVPSEFIKAGSLGTDYNTGACGNDEGAIVAIIATKIYENGAKFCTRQIQAANDKGYAWIDFYDFDGASIMEKIPHTTEGGSPAPSSWKNTGEKYSYKCETVCKPGYFGSMCNSQTGNIDDDIDYTTALSAGTNEYVTYNYYCNTTNYIKTNGQDVFFKQMVEDTAQDYDHAHVAVLGVLETKQHSITVAPIRVNTVSRNRNKSWIGSLSLYGGKTVLCAPGYVLNDTKDDCVRGNPDQDPPDPDQGGGGLDNNLPPEDSIPISKQQLVRGKNFNQECWKILTYDGYQECVRDTEQ